MEHVLFLKSRQLTKDLIDCRIDIHRNISYIVSDWLNINWSTGGVTSQLLTPMLLVLYHSLAV